MSFITYHSNQVTVDGTVVFFCFFSGRHLHSIRHHHGDGRFWFDLSEVPRPTTVLSAELRLFIDHSTAGGRDSVVSLYEIGAAGAGQDGGLVFVDRADVHRHQTGWIAFNVTLVLRNWLDNPEENLGLQLVCRDTATGATLHWTPSLLP